MGSIIVFCKTLVKGGAEKQALTLAKLLAERSMDVVIVSWSSKRIDPGNHDFIRENSLKYYGLHGGILMKFIQFNRIINKENAAIILAYLTLANFVSGVSRFFNKNLVTIGGIRTEKFPLYKLIVERFVHNYLNAATIFNNYSAKSKFENRGFDPEKIFVIHNIIRISKRESLPKIGNEIIIITVARFVKAKDFKTALFAFKGLVNNNPERTIKYVLVGYGPMEPEIRSLIRSHSLEGKVMLVINPPNVSHYLENSDIYLSTSLFEGLSNSLMEAMVAGLPIIATDVGDNGYLVKDGLNGYLVPVQNVDVTVMKLEILVKSEEMRKTFGTNSNNLVSSEFNEEKFIDGYLGLIEKITNAFTNRQIPANEKAYTDPGL
jgi:glycosyltransferase involved in cell wall biosynthesis